MVRLLLAAEFAGRPQVRILAAIIPACWRVVPSSRLTSLWFWRGLMSWVVIETVSVKVVRVNRLVPLARPVSVSASAPVIRFS